MKEAPRKVTVRILQRGFRDDTSPQEVLEEVAELVSAQRDVDLVVLSELWLHGAFSSETWAESAVEIPGPATEVLARAAASAGVTLHAGSFIERACEGESRGAQNRGLWNTSVVIDSSGAIVATYRKIHRFGFGEGEPQTIEAGTDFTTFPLRNRAGDAVGIAGLATCYDLRFPELFRCLVDRGAELFLVPAAWPQARIAHWELLGRARAVENEAFVVQCNDGGEHAGLAMGGSSRIVDPGGNVVVMAGRGPESLTAVLDLGDVATARRTFPVLQDRRISAGELAASSGMGA